MRLIKASEGLAASGVNPATPGSDVCSSACFSFMKRKYFNNVQETKDFRRIGPPSATESNLKSGKENRLVIVW